MTDSSSSTTCSSDSEHTTTSSHPTRKNSGRHETTKFYRGMARSPLFRGLLVVAIFVFIRMTFYSKDSFWLFHRNDSAAQREIIKFTKEEILVRKGIRQQPKWMYKYPFMPTEHEVPDDERVCFVHLGKTAGSTLACQLGYAYGCGAKVIIPQGKLPQVTTNLMHDQFNSCADMNFAYYLYVVRDPLKRIQSWWTYERPTNGPNSFKWEVKKPLFHDCGWYTLNDMAGDTGLGSRKSTRCSRRAWSAIRGEVPYAFHNYFNFQRYYSQIPKNSTILVIRTEHLEEDYSKAETVIGGIPLNPGKKFGQINESEKADADRILSDASRARLCYGLCKEIQMYKHILKVAVNLDQEDYETSMAELLKTCPKQAKMEECPGK